MRSSALLATIAAASLFGGPAVADQTTGRITAEQHDIGRVETRIENLLFGPVTALGASRGPSRTAGVICVN
jgi:hypothetical protein